MLNHVSERGPWAGILKLHSLNFFVVDLSSFGKAPTRSLESRSFFDNHERDIQ